MSIVGIAQVSNCFNFTDCWIHNTLQDRCLIRPTRERRSTRFAALLSRMIFRRTFSPVQISTQVRKSKPSHVVETAACTSALGCLWWRPLVARCLRGSLALGSIERHFAWQAWRLATSTIILCGRRGTWRHGRALCMAGVALMALGWLWWHACWRRDGRRGTWRHRPSLQPVLWPYQHHTFANSQFLLSFLQNQDPHQVAWENYHRSLHPVSTFTRLRTT